MLRLPRALPLRRTTSLFSRRLHTTRPLLESNGEREGLSVREQLELTRKAHELKYADKLKRKMEEEGLPTLEELKKRKIPAAQPKKAADPPAEKENVVVEEKAEKEAAVEAPVPDPAQLKAAPERDEYFVGSVRKVEGRKEGDGTGVKPLSQILNLPLVLPLPPSTLSKLWTSHHASKLNTLSASIPTPTYSTLLRRAQRYPAFVLPLPTASHTPASPQFETYYLEWGFLPPPPSLPSSPTPLRPSTLLFTPLQEYKTRQAFAQPFLALTHYVDLSAPPHELVLMKGDITSLSADPERGVLDAKDAQLLLLAMQRFYLAEEEGHGKEAQERARLLRSFHERPESFDFGRLCEVAYEL